MRGGRGMRGGRKEEGGQSVHTTAIANITRKSQRTSPTVGSNKGGGPGFPVVCQFSAAKELNILAVTVKNS